MGPPQKPTTSDIKKQQQHKNSQSINKNFSTYEESTKIDFDSVSLSQSSKLNQDFEAFDSSSSSSQLPPATSNLVNLPPKSMADLLNRSNDFQMNYTSLIRTPKLAYWYGLCKFVVITPTRSDNFIDNESRARIILTSASIAINNTGW